AGFIGSHLVEKLLATGHEVSILDDFNDFYDPQIKRANVEPVAGEVAIHRIDLRDSAAVNLLFHREKFDAIAHLAARAGVRPSIQQPQLYYDTNVSGTLHLLEAARLTGIERFIFASSSSVYGICKTVPFSEDFHLTQTISPYAATKVAGEFLCSTYSHLFNLGESETIQLKDLIAAIEKTLEKKAKINQLPEQPGDVPLTCADISKARKLLNYNPTTPLSVGLPKFVDWFLASAGLPKGT